MKRILQFSVIALFMAALWIPPAFTPFRFRQEQQSMTAAENRHPTDDVNPIGRSMDGWVRDIQQWYRDSFAFRKKLMSLYNLSHVLIRSYPDAYFGAGGHVFKKSLIDISLAPVSEARLADWSKSLDQIQQLREEADTPFLFVIIPSKETVHPELTPQWMRSRNMTAQRRQLIQLIRERNMPVVDLTPALQTYARQTRRILFQKFDNHWNVEGALAGYREMMPVIQTVVPEARCVLPSFYSVAADDRAIQHSRRYYLDSLFRESLMAIREIDLPAVKIVRDGEVRHETVCTIIRRHRAEVFCDGVGDHTVVFIRDSFLNMSSPLLNHSFAHTVYLNNSHHGLDPQHVVAAYKPDLVVIALQEKVVGQYLERMQSAASRGDFDDEF